MFKLFSNHKFWAVDDKVGGTIDLDNKSVETYDLLDTDEPEIIELEEGKGGKIKKESKALPEEEETGLDKGEVSEEGEDEEEIDELAELEKELEEPDEEKLELVTPVRRKEILAKYPKLFKDFPYLEKAYYRDQQFTEIYPSIDDARAANEKAEYLDAYANALGQGNQEIVLKEIKQSNEGGFHKIVDNYMLALYNTDQTAYHHVIGNINKTLIASMVQEGKKLQNDALIQAAAILNQFVFGTAEWSAPTRLARDDNKPENNEIQRREQEFNQRQFESARNDLQTRLSNSIKSTIEQNMDPQGHMTEYVKRSACTDAMKILEKLIGADRSFQTLKDKLWVRAAEEGFSKPAMDRIRSAFATKAKILLPTVLKKARNEALKGLGKRARDVDESEDVNDGTTKNTRPRDKRETTPSSRPSGNAYKDKAAKIPRNMSTLDYFNQD